MHTTLLVIDAQHDFCHPEGALYVPGADDDMKRLATWLGKNHDQVDEIILTLDTHQVLDISHPTFWKDAEGAFAPPFTPITASDIRSGKWIPTQEGDMALKYVETLEEQGSFGHFIWPEHCLDGSWGQ